MGTSAFYKPLCFLINPISRRGSSVIRWPPNTVLRGGMGTESESHQWCKEVPWWIILWHVESFFPIWRLSHSRLMFRFGFPCTWLCQSRGPKPTHDLKAVGGLWTSLPERATLFWSHGPFHSCCSHGTGQRYASDCFQKGHFKWVWLCHQTYGTHVLGIADIGERRATSPDKICWHLSSWSLSSSFLFLNPENKICNSAIPKVNC